MYQNEYIRIVNLMYDDVAVWCNIRLWDYEESCKHDVNELVTDTSFFQD